MDRIKLSIALTWYALYDVIVDIDAGAVFDSHWIYKLAPRRIISELVHKYGCINTAKKRLF